MATIDKLPSRYTVNLDAREFNVLLKGLAWLAGFKVTPREGDKEIAAKLNEDLLRSRLVLVKQEEKIVQDAINRVEEKREE